jgi:hypothetical protein
MRFLYISNSGNPNPQHPSRYVVFGGFSVDESNWTKIVRQLAGAKARHYPKRGNPNNWKVKSADYITRNAWNRSNNRRFCFEVADILSRNDCTVYAVYLDKSKARSPLKRKSIVPKCVQVLATKFTAELESRDCRGTIVCSSTSYATERHVSRCLHSFIISQKIANVIGDLVHGSSSVSGPLQISDLVAGAYRVFLEGGARLDPLLIAFRNLVWHQSESLNVIGHPVSTEARLF